MPSEQFCRVVLKRIDATRRIQCICKRRRSSEQFLMSDVYAVKHAERNDGGFPRLHSIPSIQVYSQPDTIVPHLA